MPIFFCQDSDFLPNEQMVPNWLSTRMSRQSKKENEYENFLFPYIPILWLTPYIWNKLLEKREKHKPYWRMNWLSVFVFSPQNS